MIFPKVKIRRGQKGIYIECVPERIPYAVLWVYRVPYRPIGCPIGLDGIL